MNARFTILQYLSNRTIIVGTDSMSAAISVAQSLDAMHHIPATAWRGEEVVFDSAVTPLPVVLRS
jgi:hypothetical protein